MENVPGAGPGPPVIETEVIDLTMSDTEDDLGPGEQSNGVKHEDKRKTPTPASAPLVAKKQRLSTSAI